MDDDGVHVHEHRQRDDEEGEEDEDGVDFLPRVDDGRLAHVHDLLIYRVQRLARRRHEEEGRCDGDHHHPHADHRQHRLGPAARRVGAQRVAHGVVAAAAHGHDDGDGRVRDEVFREGH